ncbi:hypothetical protein CKAH01_15385 [Colletotrichum kahawae]|uniref:Uncharacterized protein n=1 Tax=Colletotrichum kahawae TaxID=34407 RepID=A0AAD9YHF1_COLKA|nr:hypothetical protein CKAH01_15385 [Colletotrichum kahawae]
MLSKLQQQVGGAEQSSAEQSRAVQKVGLVGSGKLVLVLVPVLVTGGGLTGWRMEESGMAVVVRAWLVRWAAKL